MELNKIYQGDVLEVLKTWPDEVVDCIVTSPPYWGLRDYGTAKWEGGDSDCDHIAKINKHGGQRADRDQSSQVFHFTDVCGKCGAKKIDMQLGLEKTPEEYVDKMVEIFREAKRVLKKKGTFWLNLGDSYSTPKEGNTETNKNKTRVTDSFKKELPPGMKPKNLVGIPWRVAFALQADVWYLRQDIIWAKPNPMPESVTDRCTKSHEYIFLLTKSSKYYFDNEAIKEKGAESTLPRLLRGVSEEHKNVNGAPGQTPHSMNKPRKNFTKEQGGGGTSFDGHSGYYKSDGTLISDGMRNKRDVWTVTTKPYAEAHFATFPQDLIIPMVKAGCPDGGVVLDPFMGSGTTAYVARSLGKNYLGIELNPEYIKLAENRLSQNVLFTPLTPH